MTRVPHYCFQRSVQRFSRRLPSCVGSAEDHDYPSYPTWFPTRTKALPHKSVRHASHLLKKGSIASRAFFPCAAGSSSKVFLFPQLNLQCGCLGLVLGKKPLPKGRDKKKTTSHATSVKHAKFRVNRLNVHPLYSVIVSVSWRNSRQRCSVLRAVF